MNSRHVCGFEVVGRPKIHLRLLRNGAVIVKLETIPTGSAPGERSSNERPDWAGDSEMHLGAPGAWVPQVPLAPATLCSFVKSRFWEEELQAAKPCSSPGLWPRAQT